MQRQKKKQQITNKLVLKGYNIEIVPLGDWHLGAGGCDMNLIKKIIKYVLNTENCYCFGIGDLLDMVTYQSKGLMHEAKLLATAQVKTLIDLLMPIKHKILFLLAGNHEDRTIKNSALDVMDIIAKVLDVPYFGVDTHYAIQFKNGHFIKFYANHNSGGGSTAGAKINRLINLHWRAVFADIIFGAHTHDVADTKRVLQYIDAVGHIRSKIQYFICTGSCLDGTFGYPAKMALAMIPNEAKIIKIWHYGKKVRLETHIIS